MLEEQALLSAVIASPDDDEPRLAYAGWLESRNDPRGEFIRLSCQAEVRTPGSALRARIEQLFAQYGKQWQAELSPTVRSFQFSRGFIETIVIDAETFIAEFPRLAIRSPISHVILDETRPASNWGNRVSGMQELRRLRSIELLCELGRDDLGSLLTSSHLSDLRKLALGDDNCNEDSAAVVASCANLSQLESLEFLGFQVEGIKDAGVRALASAQHLANLRHLDLRENSLGPEAMKALAESIFLRSLNSLYLGDGFYTSNKVGSLGAIAIAQSPNFSKLERLHINFNHIGDEGLLAILESQSIGPLSHLSIVANDLMHASIERFTASRCCATLEYLDLSCNQIGDAGVVALAHSDFRRLNTLALSGAKMTALGLRALLATNWFRGLEMVRFSGELVGDLGVHALLQSDLPTSLRMMIGGIPHQWPSWQQNVAALKEKFGERIIFERLSLPSLGQTLSFPSSRE